MQLHSAAAHELRQGQCLVMRSHLLQYNLSEKLKHTVMYFNTDICSICVYSCIKIKVDDVNKMCWVIVKKYEMTLLQFYIG